MNVLRTLWACVRVRVGYVINLTSGFPWPSVCLSLTTAAFCHYPPQTTFFSRGHYKIEVFSFSILQLLIQAHYFWCLGFFFNCLEKNILNSALLGMSFLFSLGVFPVQIVGHEIIYCTKSKASCCVSSRGDVSCNFVYSEASKSPWRCITCCLPSERRHVKNIQTAYLHIYYVVIACFPSMWFLWKHSWRSFHR